MKKTIIKGLYLTSEGKAWHKSAKREIPINGSDKVRFNGKMYDWQKLLTGTKPKEPKTKHLIKKVIPKVKKSVSIRELQKQGFKKTTIKGLFATKSGLCYNLVSKRNLAITKGKITIHGKAYNVAKIILETFCKIPVRSGQITFKNGNETDFDFENLEYTSTIKQTAPSETEIIQCIRFYFEINKSLTRSNILFKFYLQEIALKRGFIHLHTGKDFNLFLDWVEAFRIKSKAEISRKHNYSTINGTNAINKYLSILVNDCLQDMKNGILTMKDFAPKPLTATKKIIKTNESLKNLGFKTRIPLRKTHN